MIIVLGHILALIFETALATYVAAKAWSYRPARLFVAVFASFTLLNLSSLLRLLAPDQDLGYWSVAGTLIGLCGLSLALLWLFSALYVPQWWEGSRPPIWWISLPYALALVLLGIDLVSQAGLFVAAIDQQNGIYGPLPAHPGGTALHLLFIASWAVHLAILAVAFKQDRPGRITILILGAAVVLGMTLGSASEVNPSLRSLNDLGQTTLLLAPLAYVVLQRRLFEPTRAALDLALRAMSEVVAVLDARGRITYLNPQAAQLGMRLSQSFAEALQAAQTDPADLERLLEQQMHPPSSIVFSGMKLGQPPRLWEISITAVKDHKERVHGTLLLGRDITEIERRNSQLAQEQTRLADAVRQLGHLATHDPLTDLPNRRSLEQTLEQVIQAAAHGAPSVLLFLDLDNFKLVNDTLGHPAGDEVLITVADVLSEQLRTGDLLARLGGDEFAVLLQNTTLDQAHLVAERMRDSIDAHHFNLQGQSFELGLSLGMTAIDGQQSAEAVLAQADIAMYTSKERGGNQIAQYHPDEGSFVRLARANEWVTQIKGALRDSRLLLHYQPIMDLASEQPIYYEALLRIQAEDGAISTPSQFMPAADRFGLMPALDRWIVQAALAALAQHQQMVLFINLSGRSLLDETLLEVIAQGLAASQIEPGRLGFEISERIAVHHNERAQIWLRRLSDLGCRCALDNFGTGFTSFSYLTSLAVTSIKIDGALISGVARSPHSRAVVQALHTLAQSLGKSTVAEWVEDSETIQALREIGIEYGQGYYFGQPVAEIQRDLVF